MSAELLDALLPPKAGDLEQAKLAPPLRGLVYSLDGVPALFDPSGKGDELVPTAMALWRAPAALPALRVKHPSVSHFIVGAALAGRHGHGADLMLPGVDVGALPAFERGDLVAVVVPGNPAPIAVGRAALSARDALEAARGGGGRGRAVEILQAYGDYLYALAAGAPTPNEGFLGTAVAPLPGLWQGGDDDDGEEAAAAMAAAQEQGADGDGGDGGGEAEAGAGEAAGRDNGVGPSSDAAAAAAAGPSSAAAAAEAAEPVDMDALLEAALLQALHKGVKDADLPLPGSQLWAHHIVPSRPPGSTLDVKKSRHRKISKYLQAYAKAGLLRGKEDKAGDFVVSAVDRGHDLYVGYRPFKADAQQQQQQTQEGGAAGGAAAAAAGANGGGGGGGGAQAGGGGELVVAELFKPTRETKRERCRRR